MGKCAVSFRAGRTYRIFAVFVVIIISSFYASAGSISIFEADLLADSKPVVSIDVSQRIYFGEIGRGKQTENIRVNVTNTGNVDILVTPRLADESEEIFNYTYFQRRTGEPYFKIGNFSFSIPAPSELGKNKSDYVYAKLDLRNYPTKITENIKGHSANIKFFAVAK